MEGGKDIFTGGGGRQGGGRGGGSFKPDTLLKERVKRESKGLRLGEKGAQKKRTMREKNLKFSSEGEESRHFRMVGNPLEQREENKTWQ